MARKTKKSAGTGSASLSIVRMASPVPVPVPSGRALASRRKKARKGAVLDLVGVRAQVAVAEADVTDELTKGGPAFGSFLQKVGEAVAEAQKKLDETLVSTAKSLSETKIDVIAVFEQVLDDENGQMTDGKVHMQQLPLVNYLMPTAYNFSRVYLQADMKVSEFNGASGMVIKASNENFNVGAQASVGLGGFSGSGGFNYGKSNSSTSVDAGVASDSAAGSLHMEATLEPRSNIELPRPFVLQKGPRVQIRIESSDDILGPAPAAPAGGGAAAPAPKIGRKLVLKANLAKSDGTANNGKDLRVTISDPQFNREPVLATNATGDTTITIKNEWGAGVVEPPRKQAILSVAFGLATQTLGISL